MLGCVHLGARMAFLGFKLYKHTCRGMHLVEVIFCDVKNAYAQLKMALHILTNKIFHIKLALVAAVLPVVFNI